MKIFEYCLLISLIFTMWGFNPYLVSGNDDHYRVPFTSEDILLNETLTLELGEIYEINTTITAKNNSLTLIVEVLGDSGRLWGLYVEEETFYYEKKAVTDFKSFTKIMDHVWYTVKHITRSNGSYVIAFHNSHMHLEPTTNFNFLALNSTLGDETVITKPMDHNNSQPTPGFDTITLMALIAVSIIYMREKRRMKI